MSHQRRLVQLPLPASKKLPSRGQVAVQGTLNGHAFDTVLEPDGEFGRAAAWLKAPLAVGAYRPAPRADLF